MPSVREGSATTMDEESKPFTVRDRRKFTAQGDLRPDPGAGATEEPEAAPEAAPRAVDPAPGAEPQVAEPGSRRKPAPPPEDAPPDFSAFVLSLASQAGYYLTQREGPDEENLRGARHMISILEMLADKTEGRRTASEDELMEKLLYELRMAYVERSRAVNT